MERLNEDGAVSTRTRNSVGVSLRALKLIGLGTATGGAIVLVGQEFTKEARKP